MNDTQDTDQDLGPSGLGIARLRLGLTAFVLALLFDLVDVQLDDFDDIDALHDGAALLLYCAAAWGIGQRSSGALKLLFWLPAAACAFSLAIEYVGGNWKYSFLVQLGAFLASALALVLFALGMVRLTKRSGIASSARWRRVMFEFVLLVLLPGLVIGLLVTEPVAELPFRHAPGKVDSNWWKQSIAWAGVVGSVLACFDAMLASWTSWRSAGRR